MINDGHLTRKEKIETFIDLVMPREWIDATILSKMAKVPRKSMVAYLVQAKRKGLVDHRHTRRCKYGISIFRGEYKRI